MLGLVAFTQTSIDNFSKHKKMFLSCTIIMMLVLSGFMGVIFGPIGPIPAAARDDDSDGITDGSVNWTKNNNVGSNFEVRGIIEINGFVYYTNKAGSDVTEVWVSNGTTREMITVSYPMMMEQTSDGEFIYISSDTTAFGVGKLNVSEMSFEWNTTTGFGAYKCELSLSDDETYLFVADNSGAQLEKRFTSNGSAVAATFPISFTAINTLATRDGWVYCGATNAASVKRYGQVNGTQDTTDWPYTDLNVSNIESIIIDDDGTYMYVSNGGTNAGELNKVWVNNATTVWEKWLGQRAQDIVYDNTNDVLYAGLENGSVAKYYASNGTLIWVNDISNNRIEGIGLSEDKSFVYAGNSTGVLFRIESGESPTSPPEASQMGIRTDYLYSNSYVCWNATESSTTVFSNQSTGLGKNLTIYTYMNESYNCTDIFVDISGDLTISSDIDLNSETGNAALWIQVDDGGNDWDSSDWVWFTNALGYNISLDTYWSSLSNDDNPFPISNDNDNVTLICRFKLILDGVTPAGTVYTAGDAWKVLHEYSEIT